MFNFNKFFIPSPFIVDVILVIIAGLIFPVLLIPIISILGNSEIIEEAAKALLIFFLINRLPSIRGRIIAGIFFGALFGLSESILYLNQIIQFADFRVFSDRIFWTIPMHVITVLSMVFAGYFGKKFFIIGLFFAIFIHLSFNSVIIQKFIVG